MKGDRLKRPIYRIVLVDDHTIVRQGIRKMIEAIGGLTVVGEACDGQELLNLLRLIPTDLVILDLSMPRMRGIEATHELKKLFPHIKVLILTMFKDKELLREALISGADGYILKEDSDKELHIAIEKIRQGKIYISPHLSEGLREDRCKIHQKGYKHPLKTLTKREKEILSLIAEGKSSKEIASQLFISIRTVQNHRANIMNKLGIKKIAELVRYAIHMGYIS